MKRSIACAIVLSVIMLGAVALSRDAFSADQPADSEPQIEMLVSAARGALDAVTVDIVAGDSTMEEVYRWSRRLMKAEQESAKDKSQRMDAARRHIARMLSLHRRNDARRNAGLGESEATHAGIYYVAAAKRDLERLGADEN